MSPARPFPAVHALPGVLHRIVPSGHVFLRQGTRGAVWYAKYRLPDGRQLKRRIGPAATGRGRPAAGVFTRRMAEEWLSGVLAQARSGTLPGMVQTGVTFAQACEAYLEWLLYERQRRPSTLRDYRSIMRAHLLPSFADVRVEDITVADCEHWRAQLGARGTLNNRTKVKIMTVFFGVMERGPEEVQAAVESGARPREADPAPAH